MQASLTDLVASQRFGFHRSNEEMKETLEEISSSNEFTARFACLKAWYVRASWHVKLAFLLDVVSMLRDDMCAKLMRYVGLGRFKDFNYLRSQDIPKPRRDVPLRDTNRCLNLAILEDMQRLDKAWIVTLKDSQQLNLINILVTMGGCALKRKVYDELLHRMTRSRKITAILDQLPPSLECEEGPGKCACEDAADRGDCGQRDAAAQKVTLAAEWVQCFQEIRDLYFRRMQHQGDDDQENDEEEEEGEETSRRQSKFFKEPFVLFKVDQLQKMQVEIAPPTDPKEKGDSVDFEYIQFLPEPINMMIFGYLDKDTLKVARQVSPYWAFLADQVDKERAARAKVNASLSRLNASSSVAKKTKPPKKGGKKKRSSPPPPPPPPIEVVTPPPVDPKGREKVVLLLRLFKPPVCKSFFSKTPVSRTLKEEFFTFRVTCVDPEGQRLAVSNVRCSVDFYCLKTGAPLPDLALRTSHMDFVTCMCFSPKGTHLVTGSEDTTVRYLRVSRKCPEESRVLEHDKRVTAVCCGNKYLVSGGSDTCVRVFNLSRAECESAFENSSEVTALVMDKIDSVLYAGFKSGHVKVLSLPEGVLLWDLNAHMESVSVLHLMPPILVTGGQDGVVRAWDTTSATTAEYCLAALAGNSPVTALSSEENYAVSGDCGGRVRVWNLVTGKMVNEVRICGLGQPLAGVHVSRGEANVEVFACTPAAIKVLTFEKSQPYKRGVFGPPYRTCCTEYADPEQVKERPFGILREEYLERKLERRGCVEQKLKESLEQPMLSTSVLVMAIKKRPDVFMEPVHNMVVYGRESVINN